jgi:hypothetical protein
LINTFSLAFHVSALLFWAARRTTTAVAVLRHVFVGLFFSDDGIGAVSTFHNF